MYCIKNTNLLLHYKNYSCAMLSVVKVTSSKKERSSLLLQVTSSQKEMSSLLFHVLLVLSLADPQLIEGSLADPQLIEGPLADPQLLHAGLLAEAQLLEAALADPQLVEAALPFGQNKTIITRNIFISELRIRTD